MAPSAISEYANGHGGTDTDSIVVKKNSRNDSSLDAKDLGQQAQSTINTFSTNRISSGLSMSSSSSNNHSQTTDFLGETIASTRSRFISEIGHVNAHYIDQMTLESLLDYIELERLTYMPQRGSRWDKVLKWAEFFALQISGYEKAVRGFVPESKVAAKLIWSSCRLLIELGPSNAQALETAFEVFYQIGLSLSFFLRHHELLAANSHISSDVGQAFDSLLALVREVCIYYTIRTSGLSSSDIIIDFNSVFGFQIESFYRHKSHIIEGMWKSKVGTQDAGNIHLVRQWLDIHDRITRATVRDRRAATARRDEYTCEWFERHLLDFSRSNDDILAITGPTGCGKTFLAGWAVERLHRPLDRKIYETLTYTIDSELPRERTSIAVAKGLAHQLLDTNIGDISLFKAVKRAYDLSFKGADIPAIEKALWESVNAGIYTFKKISLMIVIDGFDEIDGHDTTNSISKQIQSLASKHSHVQAILLCRRASHQNTSTTHLLEMSPELTHNDLRHITEHTLHGYHLFEDQNDHEKEAIVEHINHASQGNFLWVIFASKLLKQETTHDGFIKTLKALKDKQESLKSIISKLAASVDLNNLNTKLLLSWILVAKRPLRVEEVRSLLQVDLQKKALLSRKEDIEKEIANAFGSLVTVRNGVISFRHEAVRAHFADLRAAGTKFPTLEAIQADFTTRLLAYCKFRPMDDRQPSFEGIRNVDIDSLLKSEPLMEYALRNWIIHFRESSLYKDNGAFDLSNEFKSSFPDHVQCAILEGLYWDDENISHDAINMHRLALLIRQNILTEKHPSVLQTLITCGNLFRNVGNDTDASNVFYQASVVSRSILEKYSSLTIRCVTNFLELMETRTFTSRTEIATRKEEMLKYIIEASRHRHGNSSDVVIRYSKILAEFYVSIHEETHAETIWRELREIMITRYGKGSVEESSISGHLGVVLKKGHKHKDIAEYEREIFATSTEVELWDIHRIKITLELAVLYEAEGKLFEAEELYIMLWSRIITHCHGVHHHSSGIEVHVSMIDIVVVYVEFLRRLHRHEEAAGILICIWEEYEGYDFESEIIFLRLKAIGELMLAINLSTIAISVFQKCCTWFRAHSKYEHAESCEILITKTTKVIINTTESTSSSTETTTTTSTFTSTTTEKAITETFESVISKSKITTETISICSSLISYHVSLEQWSKAIEISRRSLELIWKTIVSGSGTIALPREFGSEAIDIAIHLAVCYHRSQHFHEAEEVYLRIYRACWNSCHFDDKRFTRAYTVLIEFYREHRHWSKLIEVYQDLLIVSRKQMGVSHALTIKLLYALGGICIEHGHANAHEYYEEIITVLNRHGNHCHKDSITALTVLSKCYYEAGLWKKVQSTCDLLWETWIHRHHEHHFEAEFIELLYARYIYVLEYHAHVEYEFLRNLTILYRSTCLAIFGASVEISVRALIKLADICMKSEKYIHEAISHYEEVIKVTKTTSKSTQTSTTVTTTTISSIEEKLSSAYIQVCSHSSVTSTTVERAIHVLTQRFEHLKITLSCSHSQTLLVLRELLLLQCKIMSEEIRVKITKTLIDVTVTIVAKEKHSKTLYEAARSLGSIYIRCGLIEEGRKMLREIRSQIISKTYGKDQKCGFQLPHSVGKASYVFLVSFEEVLFGTLTVSYSKLMADLLTEAFLYESYSRCVKSQKTERILTAGARLYVFLLSSSRKEEVAILQSELHKTFIHKWGAIIKAPVEITTVFLVTILKELGKDTRHQNVEIGHTACIATNDKVRDLLEHGHHRESFEIAQCAFTFFDHEGTYHHIQNVGYGFKLSGYIASRGLKRDFTASIEPKLRASMLELSRKIITDVLKACKHEKINFVQLKIGEVNGLVGLLGEQENYSDLEWLLQSLWTSRDVQKSWSSTTITSIGKSLVLALFLLERKKPQGTANYTKAFRLGEAISYNLRRVGGGLSPRALAVSDLLSQMYTATGHYREAMGVHEEILRLIVEGDDGDDVVSPQMAKQHLELLKRSYQRLGGWDKKPATYKELVDRVLQMPEYKNTPEFKGVQGIDKWDAKIKVDDGLGQFQVPKSWEFIDPNLIDEKGDFIERRTSSNGSIGLGSNLGFRRITNNWGMGNVYKDLFGDSNDAKEPAADEFEGCGLGPSLVEASPRRG